MNTSMFLILLFSFSTISSLFTEGIKKLFSDKANLSYNILALCVALIVGSVGTIIYYKLNNICFDTNNIIYITLLGLASGLCSMLGYDKVKQTIFQIINKQDSQN